MPRCQGAIRLALASQVALLCALLVLPTGTLRAEDIVTLRSSSSRSGERKISGEIVDYTGRELRIRLSSGREQSIRPELIVRIETNRTPEHNAGDGRFAAGDFRRAEAEYRKALAPAGETRPWMQRQILSQLVWCYRNTDQWEQAGDVFLMLVRRDPDTPYFDCIPLAWTAAQPSRSLEAKALAWLAAAEEPVAVLLGASHLLHTAQRSSALDKLRRLVQDRDPRIAWLAETQIWRTDADGATPSEVAPWPRFIEQGQESLRAGPYFVLGSTMARYDPQRAALALLEVPIMYPRHRHLAATALLSAGGCLERTGYANQAAGLYRELIDRFDEAPETGEAKRRLDELARQTSR